MHWNVNSIMFLINQDSVHNSCSKKVSPKRCSTRLLCPEKNPPRINLVKGSLASAIGSLPLAMLVFFSKNSSRQNLGEELSNLLIPLPSCKRPNRIQLFSKLFFIDTTNVEMTLHNLFCWKFFWFAFLVIDTFSLLMRRQHMVLHGT